MGAGTGGTVSQADVQMLRRGFEAFAREGIAGIFDFATEDFELVTPIVGEEPSLGREGAISALEDQFQVFEHWTVQPEEFIDLGRHIVVVVRQHVRTRRSGVVIDTTAAWTFELRDGKAARLTIHTDKDEALAALDQSRRQ
jgi:ketosteroid isomerase-like protein